MKRFKNIVVVPAEIAADDSGYRRAVELALTNGAGLTVAWPVDEGNGAAASEIVRAVSEALSDELEKMVRPARDEGVSVATRVIVGRPFVEIIRLVLEETCDLVIKTARGRRLRTPLLFGTTALHLLRKCPCPVWIVDPEHEAHKGGVLAAVDSDTDEADVQALNDKIMELATSLAAIEGVDLHVVHAWHLPYEDTIRHSPFLRVSRRQADNYIADIEGRRRERFEALVARFRDRAPDLVAHFVKGLPAMAVTDLAREIDAEVIVMATLVRGGVPGLLIGNTAENVIGAADCSVLTVKPEGFVSPVGG